MSEDDEILAIPLWINGRAFLTMAAAFFDVRDPRSGEVRRRIPLCGASEALAAVESASRALPAWAALTVEERATALATLADSLAGYGKHFADLIVEETGMDEALAIAEIQAGLGVLRGLSTDTKSSGGVVAVLGDERAPLLGLLRHAVPALLAGAAVVVKPSPRAPSAAFALAELTAESGFPAGVFNILHGDLAAIEGLCAAGAIAALHFSGDPALGARVAAIAGRHGKVFVD